MQEVDKRIASPAERGKKVYDLTKDAQLDSWDMICAACEILNFLAPTFKQAEGEIKALSKQVFSAHYLYLFNDILSIDELQAEFAKSGAQPSIPPTTPE